MVCLIATSPEQGILTTNLPIIGLLPQEHQKLQNQQIENLAHWEMVTSSKELDYDIILPIYHASLVKLQIK